MGLTTKKKSPDWFNGNHRGTVKLRRQPGFLVGIAACNQEMTIEQRGMSQMPHLYVFVDESGNDDFSESGTNHWVITSLITTDITQAVIELYELKHEMIDHEIDIEYFHATEDRQQVRDEVFPIIAHLHEARIDSVIVEKRKTAPTIRPIEKFYPMMIKNLLQYPFHPLGIDVGKYEKVLIFLDRAAASRKKRETLKKAIKTYLKPYCPGVPYTICMHASMSHPFLQIVDYCSWAIYVKWERGEYRPYQAIQDLVRSEFPIFAHGCTDWY